MGSLSCSIRQVREVSAEVCQQRSRDREADILIYHGFHQGFQLLVVLLQITEHLFPGSDHTRCQIFMRTAGRHELIQILSHGGHHLSSPHSGFNISVAILWSCPVSRSLSSGSGPASPWCFTCTDTTRGCSTVTPPQPPPMPSRDQSHPHRADAGGHLCHLLCAEFHFCFFHRCVMGPSTLVGADLS